MYYFSTFPLTFYSVNNGAIRTPVDITKRFILSNATKKVGVTYYTYHVQDGERPDMLADRFYKDSRLDWLILMVNEIQDPQFSWVMDYYTLNQYIIQKYGSVSVAQGNVHHYEWIYQAKSQMINPDGEVVFIPEKIVTVDLATYNSLPATSTRAVSNYDYEVELNDSHRQINLIDPGYLAPVLRAYQSLFG
jgi:Base plate wedge protein 53